MSHPAIKLAAVVGLPDARLSEVGVAFVQLRARPRADRARGDRALPRPHGELQDAPPRRLRRRVPHDQHRQDPEGEAPRGGHSVSRAARAVLSRVRVVPVGCGVRLATAGDQARAALEGQVGPGPLRSTTKRLRNPIRKRMWTKSQASQAMQPESWTRPIWATAAAAADRGQRALVAVVERQRAARRRRRASDVARRRAGPAASRPARRRARRCRPASTMRQVADRRRPRGGRAR